MKTTRHITSIWSILTACMLTSVGFVFPVSAADEAPNTVNAKELASRLSALQQDGSSYVRIRLNVNQPSGATKSAYQIQIRQRRTKGTTDVVYQVLWPKEKKGEAVMLSKSGNQSPTGTLYIPPETVKTLSASQMREPLFDSDLCYADIIENFFAWDSQTIVGQEKIGRVNCVILESKPGGQRSTYSKVRSWIDLDRLIPLRVEKFLSSSGPARRIETTKVNKEDDGRYMPSELRVQGPNQGSVTVVEGSRIDTSVDYGAEDFTVESLKKLKP